jgi:hypothetical protein
VDGMKVGVLQSVFSDRPSEAAIFLRASVPCETVFRPPDTLLPEHCQPFAVEVEIHQGEVRAQPVVVLGDAAVPRLLEAEDTLQDAEHMFDLGSYTGLCRVLPLGFFVHIVLIFRPAAGHVPGMRSGPLIASVWP